MSTYILVVDDEPDVEALFRQQFRRELRAQRFTMDFANSAASALARIAETMEQSLVLILSDVNMPGMTGIDLLRHTSRLRPHMVRILLTGYTDVEVLEVTVDLDRNTIDVNSRPEGRQLRDDEILHRYAAG